MSRFERFSCFLGILLIGTAAFLRKGRGGPIVNKTTRDVPAVEQLGEQLKEAWAEHHIS